MKIIMLENYFEPAGGPFCSQLEEISSCLSTCSKRNLLDKMEEYYDTNYGTDKKRSGYLK